MLALSDVSYAVGAFEILSHVTLQAKPGEVTGIIGPNGAGKSTLLNVASGFLRPRSGRVEFFGENIGGLPPFRIARLGLGRTFQITREMGPMRVQEVVETAAFVGRSRRAGRQFAGNIIERLGLRGDATKRVQELSTGGKQLVEFARALAGDPRMVLLDEVFAGLSADEVQRIGELIRAMRSEGIGFVVIDHDVPIVSALCDVLFALDAGAVIAQGRVEEVLSDSHVRLAYLGT